MSTSEALAQFNGFVPVYCTEVRIHLRGVGGT